MWCPGCVSDKTFRYVRENAVEKTYECLDCETPQGIRKQSPPVRALVKPARRVVGAMRRAA